VGSHGRKGQTGIRGSRSLGARNAHTNVRCGFSLGDERANGDRLIYPLRTVQNKCLGTITGAYKTTNVQVLEHEASVVPLNLHLDMLAVSHVRITEGSAGSWAVGETCKAIDQGTQRRFNFPHERQHSCETHRSVSNKGRVDATATVPG
jgi:hypothetical protein